EGPGEARCFAPPRTLIRPFGAPSPKGRRNKQRRIMSTGTDHIIKSYDTELSRLTAEIVRMGELSVKQLEAAIDVVERRDERAAQRAADIERIGDYAANVAKRSIPLSMVAPVQPARGLEHLARLAATGVREVLAAYQERDAERAHAVWKNDTVLDEAYTGYFRQLLTYMMEDPRNITPCTHLLFMAKNIERIGDHATNIAENVWFQVTGEPLQSQRRKLDQPSSADFSGLAGSGDKPARP